MTTDTVATGLFLLAAAAVVLVFAWLGVRRWRDQPTRHVEGDE
jgi:ABC-type transporter Mla subunit MlaD